MEIENNDWIDIPKPKGELLTYRQQGVLWLQGGPYYIIDYIKDPYSTYVMVYGVQLDVNGFPMKQAKEIPHKRINRFSESTRLGQLANHILPKKQTKKLQTKPPIFIAPVVPNQKATLTGEIEDVFYEREPDRMGTIAGEKTLIKGRSTGVAVGMSSIVWNDGYTIDTNSILNALTQYKDDMFYDLGGVGGDNEDPDNPLGRYYKHLK